MIPVGLAEPPFLSMIRKSMPLGLDPGGYQFSEKIMLKQKERDDESKKSHPALSLDHAPDSPPVAIPVPDIPEISHLNAARPDRCSSRSPKCRSRASAACWSGARRGVVDRHRWMTADEFNETFALCHFLPGPNIVNLSVVFGSRFRGIPGGLAAFAGLVGPPVVIVTVLAALYARYGEIDALRRILAGVSCAAVGLLLSAVFRMMMPLIKRRDLIALVILAAVFIAVGLLRLPLPAVLLVASPVSIAIAFAVRRRVG
jgi:chromate transporter